eukprot:gene7304-7375_t
MMALFLVLWLISASDKNKQAIAHYFNPVKLQEMSITKPGLSESADGAPSPARGSTPAAKETVAVEKSGSTGAESGEPAPKFTETELFHDPFTILDKIAAQVPKAPAKPAAPNDAEATPQAFADPFTPSTAPPALTPPAPGKEAPPVSEEPKPAEAKPVDSKPTDAKPADVKSIDGKLADAKLIGAIQKIAEQSGGNVKVTMTPDGALISVTEGADFPMFASSSAEPQPKMVLLMAKVGDIIKTANKPIVVRGYTDSRAFRANNYDNWRLSADRANMARLMLLRGGVPDKLFDRVEGHADRQLKNPTHPELAENRRRGEYVKVLCGFFTIFLGVGPAVAQEATIAAAQPFELVRSLQSLQDKIGSGNKAMQDARPSLMARLTDNFKTAPDSVWADVRNQRAAIIYLLNGGDRRIVQALYTKGVMVKSDSVLFDGTLAYVSGDLEKAGKAWDKLDTFAQPASLGSHVAFAQAALAVKDDPEKAIKLLDVARLLAPGTLIEEAALRRELTLLKGPEKIDAYFRLAIQYLRRFNKSLYSDEVRKRLIRVLPAMLSEGKHGEQVGQVLELLPDVDVMHIYLTAAGSAVTRGHVEEAENWANTVLAMRGVVGIEKSRALLYRAAALVNQMNYAAAREALEPTEKKLLVGPDAQLLLAVQAILALDPQSAGPVRPPVAEEAKAPAVVAADPAGTVPENLIQNVQALLAGTDKLLSDLADIAQTLRLPDTKKGEPAKAGKDAPADMDFALALTRQEHTDAAASGSASSDSSSTHMSSSDSASASSQTSTAEPDPSTRLRLALNLATAMQDAQSASPQAVPAAAEPSPAPADSPLLDTLLPDATAAKQQDMTPRQRAAVADVQNAAPDQNSKQEPAVQTPDVPLQVAVPVPSILPQVQVASASAPTKQPTQSTDVNDTSLVFMPAKDAAITSPVEPTAPAPVQTPAADAQQYIRPIKADSARSAAVDSLALLQAPATPVDPSPAANEGADNSAKKPEKASEARSSSSDSTVSVAPAATATQMALNLVSVLVPNVAIAAQQTAVPSARADTATALPTSATSGVSPARASARLSVDTSASVNTMQNADMSFPDPILTSVRSGQSAAQRNLSAATLSEHLIRATISGNGASSDAGQTASPMKVKVLEVETHLPVATQSDSLFATPSHSGHAASSADIGIDDSGASAPTDTSATPTAHQTALRTLNLALSGEDSAPLSVRMRLQGDQLNVAISSQHADAVAAILRDHSSLSESLIGAGYKLDNLSVQVSAASSGSSDNSESNKMPEQIHLPHPDRARTLKQMFGLLMLVLVPTFIFNPLPVQAGEAAGRCEAEMTRAAQRNHVPVAVLYAVGLTETGRRGWLNPYAMNIEGRPYFAKDLPDAVRAFTQAKQQGLRLIDIGCMQIDHHYHAQNFRSLDDMFDPQQNVAYAVQMLQQLKAQHGSWTLAVARYHAGPNKTEEQRRYVCSVLQNMVSTGMGAWTPAAKQFCQPKLAASEGN